VSRFSAGLPTDDFHGAILTVVRSVNPGYVGLTGICVKETKKTFQLISKDDSLKIVPKSGSVFRFDVNLTGKDDERPFAAEIQGSSFLFRPSERVGKKIKGKRSTPKLVSI